MKWSTECIGCLNVAAGSREDGIASNYVMSMLLRVLTQFESRIVLGFPPCAVHPLPPAFGIQQPAAQGIATEMAAIATAVESTE